VWDVLGGLGVLPRLQALTVAVTHTGAGLEQLAASADALAGRLTSLKVDAWYDEREGDEEGLTLASPALAFIGGLRALRALDLQIAANEPDAGDDDSEPPVPIPGWVARLLSLERLVLAGATPTSSDAEAVAPLLPLARLRRLSVRRYKWEGGASAVRLPASVGTVLSLKANLPSLVASSPGVEELRLHLCDHDSPQPGNPQPGNPLAELAPPAPGAAAWERLRRLMISGLNAEGLPPVLRAMGARGLRELSAHFNGIANDGIIAALLAEEPRLERLHLGFITGSVKGAAFANLPPRPALRSLKVVGVFNFRVQLTPDQLLDLGRALPGLSALQLGGGGWQKEREALDALGGGAGAGAGAGDSAPDGEPLGSDSEPDAGDAHQLEPEGAWASLDRPKPGSGLELLRSIRGALRRLD
jgi:hypothetical protein